MKIYGIEKTIADCFKFRNKIGLDMALEAIVYSEVKNLAAFIRQRLLTVESPVGSE